MSETVAYRFADYGTPLRVVPSRADLRFSRAGDTSPTQYLSLHPLGPHAEHARANGLRHPEQLVEVRLRTWALRVPLDDGVEQIGFDEAARWGIDPAELVADDHRPCQQLAQRLRAEGRTGLIVPSAALPGTQNVVLFGERVALAYLGVPFDPIDVPASLTASEGRGPLRLAAVVRYRGTPHQGLDAWRTGRELRLDDEALWALPDAG